MSDRHRSRVTIVLLVSTSHEFEIAWPQGYFEGNPLDPIGPSTYLTYGYLSSLYVTYKVCIEPYIDAHTTVLEIGPGRGAWTKAILASEPRKVWAVDVTPPERT